MDWTCFDNAAKPPVPGRPGLSLMARVDVGYGRDERDHEYENIPQYDTKPMPAFVVWGDCNSEKMVEAARLVFGADAMTVDLRPGKDLHIVMRTWPSHKATARGGFGTKTVITYGFSNPLKIRILIDGNDSGIRDVAICENGFSDVEMVVDGKMIEREHSRIEFQGDHIACAYWFYQ